MTDISLQVISKPGVKRDGTDLDSDYFRDAQWVRFQRGRPRKMGGYSAISDAVTGPIRDLLIDARAAVNTAHTFSPFGVQQLAFDNNGAGAGIVERTPAGFVRNDNYTWQSTSMYSGGGSAFTALICAATPDLLSIADPTNGPVYSGDITATAALTAVSDGAPIQVSGGCVVLNPFLFVYGNNGLIRNSNANDFSVATVWVGTNANIANVAGTKVVKGLPVRGGANNPAGLFWALDSLLRVSFVGGARLWTYDTISDDISVLSKHSMIEYSNIYYWVGVDKFYMYSGVVQELPNEMNANFFFDNVNMNHRQKVWVLKVPRFGEIWWFFPFGTSTECDAAIIYNVHLNTWYDTRIVRSAGRPAKVFKKPIMAGGQAQSTIFLSYTAGAGVFAIGNVVTGGVSGAVGTIARVIVGGMNLINVTGVFNAAEAISSGAVTGTTNAAPVTQQLDAVWQHETGTDQIVRSNQSAIEAYFETSKFQWMTGGPAAGTKQPGGKDQQTRMLRMEPDFIAAGNLELTIKGSAYAQSSDEESDIYLFDGSTEFVDVKEQRREMSVKVKSNVLGGNFETGLVMFNIEPGDERG
jgi:hypothetical protein